MAERAQLKHALFDVDFRHKPKMVAMRARFGEISALALFEIVCQISRATDAIIERDTAVAVAESLGLGEDWIDYVLDRGLLDRVENSTDITQERVIKDQEKLAKTRKVWREKKQELPSDTPLEKPIEIPLGNPGVIPPESLNTEVLDLGSRSNSERGTGGKPKRQPAEEPPLTFPPHLDTPDCRAAWSDWVEFKATEKRERYKTTKTQNIAIAEVGTRCPTPREFIAAINFSISSRYSGIFPPPVARTGPIRSSANRTREELDEAFSDLIAKEQQ